MTLCCNIKGLYSKCCKAFSITVLDFDVKSVRLEFLSTLCLQNKKYSKLWEVMKTIFSHGQASIEREFSINKQLEVENLKDLSYILQRLAYDYV